MKRYLSALGFQTALAFDMPFVSGVEARPDNTEKKWSNTIKRPKLKSDEYNEPLSVFQIK
ncbi:hypothetical protein VCRA2120E57_460036 [Vibrio crassostreae]|nr:hypothetical protein VCRA2120E57_460036 [Vibrio crassostreae]